MKIRKLIMPLLMATTLTSCGYQVVKIPTSESTSAVSTTINVGSKIDRIAQEIGYDYYTRGSWADLDFTYEIKEIASVGASIKYYVITFNYSTIFATNKMECYVKVSGNEWEIMSQRSV